MVVENENYFVKQNFQLSKTEFLEKWEKVAAESLLKSFSIRFP